MTERELSQEILDTVAKFSPNEKELLLEHTARILDRHAEVEQDQRKVATRVFQVWVAGAGVFVAAVPYIQSFIESISLAENIPPFQGVVGMLLVMFGILFLLPIPGMLSEIPSFAAEVLTPEPYDFGPLRKFTFVLPIGPNRDDTGRGDIRSVSMSDELLADLKSRNPAYDEKLLRDRLIRVRDNEDSINRNSTQLTTIFYRFNLAIELTVIALFFLLYGLILLTV